MANGVVYVGGGDIVYALDAHTGVQLWSYGTGNFVPSSPAVANGWLYIASYDDNVYAFGLPRGDEANHARPALNALRPDFSLKASRPASAP